MNVLFLFSANVAEARKDVDLGMASLSFSAPIVYGNISQSIPDFWQRWHISLSSWMRDYLYIPLGGSRFGKVRTYFNLVLVFLVSGFWHGANWTFLAWGAFHGFFLILDRIFLVRILEKIPKAARILIALFIVMVGWVLFRAENIHAAVNYVASLFAFADHEAFQRTSVSWGEILPGQSLFYGIVGISICMLHFWPKVSERIHQLVKSDQPSET